MVESMGKRFARTLPACALVVAGLFAAPAVQAQPVKSLLEIRQENLFVQEWDLSCGAAALATVLRYQHGLDVTEKEVAIALINREEYLGNPDLVRYQQGFSLLDLKRYTDSQGLEGIGLGQLGVNDLAALAPIIVPVNLYGYNHFVVVRGMWGNRVLLADPAYGNRTITIERLRSAWIDYAQIGHVGFIAVQPDGLEVPNLLRAKAEDFLFIN